MLATARWSARRSVAPQSTLMFVPSGSIADRDAPRHRAASNAFGAMPEYAPFAQSTPIARPVRSVPKRSSDVLEVARQPARRALSMPPPSSRRRSVEQRLDLLLLLVGELAAVAVEELDAVVLGRVVRGGDDDAEVERRAARRRASAARRRAPRVPPAEATPRANARSSSRPDARVSRPTNTRPPPPRASRRGRAARRARASGLRRRRRVRRRCRSSGGPCGARR